MRLIPTMSHIVHAVRRLAVLYPEATYRQPDEMGACMYTVGDVTNGPIQEGCIIGQALIAEGVAEDASNMDTQEVGAPDMLRQLVNDSHLAQDIAGIDQSTVRQWFGWVQSTQDQGMTWAEAIRAADDHHDITSYQGASI